jgi:hypothetical protein
MSSLLRPSIHSLQPVLAFTGKNRFNSIEIDWSLDKNSKTTRDAYLGQDLSIHDYTTIALPSGVPVPLNSRVRNGNFSNTSNLATLQYYRI